MSETEFQDDVLARAELFGYSAFHHPDSRQVTHRGLPDLILLHRATGRIIFAELKTATGTLLPEQREFLEAAALDPANEVALWRPADLDEIDRVLSGSQRAELRLPERPEPARSATKSSPRQPAAARRAPQKKPRASTRRRPAEDQPGLAPSTDPSTREVR